MNPNDELSPWLLLPFAGLVLFLFWLVAVVILGSGI